MKPDENFLEIKDAFRMVLTSYIEPYQVYLMYQNKIGNENKNDRAGPHLSPKYIQSESIETADNCLLNIQAKIVQGANGGE